MINRLRQWIPETTTLVVLASLTAIVALPGCGGEPEKPKETTRRAPEPTPPPPPRVLTVKELIRQMSIDPRVTMSEANAPSSTDERKGLLTFFDAFARGDVETLSGMLQPSEQVELSQLVASGQWSEAVSQITSIDLATGRSPLGQKAVLAIIELVEGYQPTLWYYQPTSVSMIFEAAPTPPGMIDRLSKDWIESWHAILEEEIELAMTPDIEIEEDDEEYGSSSTSSNSGPAGVGSGGGNPPSNPGSPTAPKGPQGPL
jgi:hypothetical protein